MDSLEHTRPEVGEWNEFGEAASAAPAGNLFNSEMVRATNDPWSYAVSPCNRSYGSKFEIMVCCYSTSAATIPSSSADTAVLLWVMLYIS